MYMCKTVGTMQRKKSGVNPLEGDRPVGKIDKPNTRYKVVFTKVRQTKCSGYLRGRRMLPDRAARKHYGREVAFEMNLTNT